MLILFTFYRLNALKLLRSSPYAIKVSNSNNPLAQSALGLGQNNLQSVTSIDNKFTRTAIGGSILPNIQAIQTDPAFRNLKVTASGLAGLASFQVGQSLHNRPRRDGYFDQGANGLA